MTSDLHIYLFQGLSWVVFERFISVNVILMTSEYVNCTELSLDTDLLEGIVFP